MRDFLRSLPVAVLVAIVVGVLVPLRDEEEVTSVSFADSETCVFLLNSRHGNPALDADEEFLCELEGVLNRAERDGDGGYRLSVPEETMRIVHERNCERLSNDIGSADPEARPNDSRRFLSLATGPSNDIDGFDFGRGAQMEIVCDRDERDGGEDYEGDVSGRLVHVVVEPEQFEAMRREVMSSLDFLLSLQ